VKLNQLPNIISIFRFLLVVPVIWALLHAEYVTALVLFAVAGFSDALDGFLAKHFLWQSRLGSILDPLADKLLLVSCYLTLAWLSFIPVWLVAAVILRDVLIVIGGVAFHLLYGQFEMSPSRISKLNTFFQIAFVLAVVFYHGDFMLKPWIIEALGYIVLVTTVTSGADYVWVWGHKAVQAAKQKQQHSS
jgi:cardiolipin synthase